MNLDENLSLEEREKRVFNLNVELADLLTKKKSTMCAYKDEEKRIRSEIKDYIRTEQSTFEIV